MGRPPRDIQSREYPKKGATGKKNRAREKKGNMDTTGTSTSKRHNQRLHGSGEDQGDHGRTEPPKGAKKGPKGIRKGPTTRGGDQKDTTRETGEIRIPKDARRARGSARGAGQYDEYSKRPELPSLEDPGEPGPNGRG